jgi:hypothetical protein
MAATADVHYDMISCYACGRRSAFLPYNREWAESWNWFSYLSETVFFCPNCTGSSKHARTWAKSRVKHDG